MTSLLFQILHQRNGLRLREAIGFALIVKQWFDPYLPLLSTCVWPPFKMKWQENGTFKRSIVLIGCWENWLKWNGNRSYCVLIFARVENGWLAFRSKSNKRLRASSLLLIDCVNTKKEASSAMDSTWRGFTRANWRRMRPAIDGFSL